MRSAGPLARRRSARSEGRSNAAAEVFRVLRSNLLVAIAELDNPYVVVTSATAGEGKTSTCVGLAESLAAAGWRVVLVDCDLRSPDSHRLLGMQNSRGLTDVLLDRRSLTECLQKVSFKPPSSTHEVSFALLAAGPPVSDPTEILSKPQTAAVLGRLAADADIVIIDAPPVLPVADTLIVGRLAAGVVLVVEARQTPIPAAKRARDVLIRNEMRLLGIVLNKFDAKYAPPEYGIYGEPARANGVDDRPRARA